MIRKNKKYSIREIFNWIEITPDKIRKYTKELDGDFINPTSIRYKIFKLKGVKCVGCGVEGKYFVKEKTPDNLHYHLNLYGIDKSGDEVLMTKDHIIPSSRGGSNDIENLQPMCITCNREKGNNIEIVRAVS